MKEESVVTMDCDSQPDKSKGSKEHGGYRQSSQSAFISDEVLLGRWRFTLELFGRVFIDDVGLEPGDRKSVV